MRPSRTFKEKLATDPPAPQPIGTESMDAAHLKRLELVTKQLSVQQAELESLRDEEQMVVDALPEGDEAEAEQSILDEIESSIDLIERVVKDLDEVVKE